MRIACVGGGPAGLYFALLMKLSEPRHEITIFEKSRPGATRGWGVVFWDDLLEQLQRADPQSARRIEEASFHWDGQVVDVRGTQVRDPSLRGYGINRQRLLDVLTRRAQDAGVLVEFGHEVGDPSQLPEADLIVACDGVNSPIRLGTEGFQTDVQLGRNRYIWLGTDKIFESFTFPFVPTDSGWVWAHAYGIDVKTSTFIVECTAETYAGLGFDTMSPDACLSALEDIFAGHLDGHQLIGQFPDGTNAPWLNFRTVTNQRWYRGNIVLAGDAAHTTHFTIGSGTKLAIEDAVALAGSLRRHGELELALRSYEGERRAALLQPQSDARLSAQWFENISRYIDVGPHQFFTLLHARRSLLLPRVSPRFYYRLHRAAQEIPVLRGFRRQLGTAGSKLYGWRKSRAAGPAGERLSTASPRRARPDLRTLNRLASSPSGRTTFPRRSSAPRARS